MTAEISLLGKFITGLLVTPQSNADYERLFSMVRENKTELHSSMTVDTLSALIAVKVNLFRSVKCHHFKPSKDVIPKAKNATLVSLSSNRN